MDGEEIDAIPYDIVKDKQGNIVELRDTGGIIRIASTYLPAFYVGVRTARFDETQARSELERETTKRAQYLAQQLKDRMQHGQ
jgi:hypothetical protein